MKGRLILDSHKVKQKLQRIALQIFERNQNQTLVIAGIQQGGFEIALRVAAYLHEFSGMEYRVYPVELNKLSPLSSTPESPLGANDLTGATLVLIDDVQNSGRTMMYAIRHFLQFDLRSIQTCVLVDRGHHQFPVHCDYVGLSLSTTLQEHVEVRISDGQPEVYLG